MSVTNNQSIYLNRESMYANPALDKAYSETIARIDEQLIFAEQQSGQTQSNQSVNNESNSIYSNQQSLYANPALDKAYSDTIANIDEQMALWEQQVSLQQSEQPEETPTTTQTQEVQYVQQPVQYTQQPTQEELEAKGCTDGKDDGKIGFFEGVKSFFKGAGNALKEMVTYPFKSPGNFIKTAVGVAACFIPVVGPAIAVGMGAIGVAKGVSTVAKGIDAASNATTDAEKKAALENIGGGTLTAAVSAVAVKGGVTKFKAQTGIGGGTPTSSTVSNFKANKAGGMSTGELIKTTVKEGLHETGANMKAAGTAALDKAKETRKTIKNNGGIRKTVSKQVGHLKDVTKEKINNSDLIKELKTNREIYKLGKQDGHPISYRDYMKTNASDIASAAKSTLKNTGKNIGDKTIELGRNISKNAKGRAQSRLQAEIDPQGPKLLGDGVTTNPKATFGDYSKATVAEGWKALPDTYLYNAGQIASDAQDERDYLQNVYGNYAYPSQMINNSQEQYYNWSYADPNQMISDSQEQYYNWSYADPSQMISDSQEQYYNWSYV